MSNLNLTLMMIQIDFQRSTIKKKFSTAPDLREHLLLEIAKGMPITARMD